MLIFYFVFCCVFFFKQKTAYEMRISDWSSDVCSSDLSTNRCVDCRCNKDSRLEYESRSSRPCRRLRATTPTRRDLPTGDWRVRKIGRASCRERVCQYV